MVELLLGYMLWPTSSEKRGLLLKQLFSFPDIMWTSEKGNLENDDLSISDFARNRNQTLKLNKRGLNFPFG